MHGRLAPLPGADDEFVGLYYKNRDSKPPERVTEFQWRKEMERRQRRALGDGYSCLGERIRGDPSFAAGCEFERAIPDEFRHPPPEGRAAFFAARGRDPTGLSFLHSLDARPLTQEDLDGQAKAREMFLEWQRRCEERRTEKATKGKPIATQWEKLKAKLREALGRAKAAEAPRAATAAPAAARPSSSGSGWGWGGWSWAAWDDWWAGDWSADQWRSAGETRDPDDANLASSGRGSSSAGRGRGGKSRSRGASSGLRPQSPERPPRSQSGTGATPLARPTGSAKIPRAKPAPSPSPKPKARLLYPSDAADNLNRRASHGTGAPKTSRIT